MLGNKSYEQFQKLVKRWSLSARSVNKFNFTPCFQFFLSASYIWLKRNWHKNWVRRETWAVVSSKFVIQVVISILFCCSYSSIVWSGITSSGAFGAGTAGRRCQIVHCGEASSFWHPPRGYSWYVCTLLFHSSVCEFNFWQ